MNTSGPKKGKILLRGGFTQRRLEVILSEVAAMKKEHTLESNWGVGSKDYALVLRIQRELAKCPEIENTAMADRYICGYVRGLQMAAWMLTHQYDQNFDFDYKKLHTWPWKKRKKA